MHNYYIENMSNDIFYFSLSIVELKLQTIGSLERQFFATFNRKSMEMLILILFSRILSSLIEKQ